MFVRLVMWFFVRYFRITARIPRQVAQINEPYLLLANHFGRYDPFILSYFIGKPPHFISSDAILRDWPIGSFFKGLGAIPKKKGFRDTRVVRDMRTVVQAGGALALFPEGTRTWAGDTLYIDPAVAKLARLLGVPVITARMQGAYAFDPRWASPLRRARVVIDYELTLTKEEVRQLTEEEAYKKIAQRLSHNDIEWLRQHRVLIGSGRRAEHIGKIIFQCPQCKSFAGFKSHKNRFVCRHCQLPITIDEYGFFTAPVKLPFDNPYKWFYWQADNFITEMLKQLTLTRDTPLFEIERAVITRTKGAGRMQKMGTGSLAFYPRYLRITLPGHRITICHRDIDYLGPQYMERLEMFEGDYAWRFTPQNPDEPGVKWELAINTAWALAGQHTKLAPYWRERILQRIQRVREN